MTYHQFCIKSNTTGATCGAGTAYHSEAPVVSDVRVYFLCSVLEIVVCPSVLCLLGIVLSVLRFTDCGYPFGMHSSSLFIDNCLLLRSI